MIENKILITIYQSRYHQHQTYWQFNYDNLTKNNIKNTIQDLKNIINILENYNINE